MDIKNTEIQDPVVDENNLLNQNTDSGENDKNENSSGDAEKNADKAINKNTNNKKRGLIPIGFIARVFFTVLAAANLVLLFVFDYDVPGFSYVITKLENYRDHVEGVDGTFAEADNTVIFEYDKDTYTYEGKGEFDPTVDVTVKDLDGAELSKDYLSFSVTGEASKKIVYTYQNEDGVHYGTTNRDLKLENYNAPVIVLSGTVPALTDKNLAKVKELCAGIYTATDGYGKDITDRVTISAVPDTKYNGDFVVKFSVTNEFGDTAQNELVTATEFKKPHLKLTQKEVTLARGETFDPLAYILYAVDAEGNNLVDYVVHEGEVETLMTGDYEVRYDLSDLDGIAVKTKILIVHVVEP